MSRETDARVLADLDRRTIASTLAGDGLRLSMGPFNARIQTNIGSLAEAIRRFYAAHPVLAAHSICSFHVRAERARATPRLYRKSVRFLVDDLPLHEELPREHAIPVFEWGVNLVIALRCYAFVMLHAAVLEKDGRTVLLPAAPGDGKSTLCAALACRGWRLLSDEFGLIRPGTNSYLPIPRPIALKNESIDVIREFAPSAELGPSTEGTRKGTVAHVKPPAHSVELQHVPAEAQLIVFPKWLPESPLELTELPKAEAFMRVALNAFNYELLGERGFRTVQSVVDASRCFQLEYSQLDEAVGCLAGLLHRGID